MTEKPTPVTELLQLCAADYKAGAPQRIADHRDDAHLVPYTTAPPVGSNQPQRATSAPTPGTLDTAIRVAQHAYTVTGGVDHGDQAMLSNAHGIVREALRILLHALGAEPDEEKGCELVRTPGGEQRCSAAHPEDPTPCVGPVVVTVLDAQNAGADGCEHHAARLLASLEGGRVYGLPHAEAGTAIRVFKAADGIRPFPWIQDAPRTRPEHLSRAENRARGEGQ